MEVRGADWNLELGAISELNVKKEKPPALLFDEISGYPKGFRVLTCSTSSPARLSSILRLPIKTEHRQLVDELRGKPRVWESQAAKYGTVSVNDGCVFENIQTGPDVDILTFPAPFWHELDGGRYIGTGCSVVTRDFDSDWVNVGTYRMMVHDRNHVGLDMIAGKHGRIHYDKYKKAGKPFPVVVVLGGDPLGYLISGIEIPFGMCEYDYMGAILSEPVAVVYGEVTGLPFPSASEIVLEGWVQANDERTEGPFGAFVIRLHPAFQDNFGSRGEGKSRNFPVNDGDGLAENCPHVVVLAHAERDLDSGDEITERVPSKHHHNGKRFAGLFVFIVMDAAMFPCDHVEPDMITVMNHHPVGADVDPIRIEITRHNRAARTDVASAIQLVPEGCRKSEDVDIGARLDVFENTSVIHTDGPVLGCL